MPDKIKHFYEFQEFRLDAANPSLWRDGELVSISPKALETLILLITKKGEIVSRNELLEKVWKDTFVEEGNINYTISLLRKTLGDHEFIQTVPKRGYRFTGLLKEISEDGKVSPEILTQPAKPIAEKRPLRWILAAVFLISFLFLTSFAYFWRNDKPAKSSTEPADENSSAMQKYLRGKMILESRSVENREEKAIDEFQQALTLDPTLALAYAGLAEGFATTATKLPHPRSLDFYAKAKSAAEKSLALDANLAEGWMIYGWLKRNADWDFAGAEADLRRAIELNPNSATAHQRLAQTIAVIGDKDEALSEIEVAYRLDPVSETIISVRFPILESRGEYEKGLKSAEDFLRENKENPFAARAYATFLYHLGDFPKVIEVSEKALAKKDKRNSFAWLSLLAASYQKTENYEKAAERLKELETLSFNDTKPLYSLAMNYAELGKHDEAIGALQKCFNLREERIIWIKNEPRFANLKNDSRFLNLVKKMNL